MIFVAHYWFKPLSRMDNGWEYEWEKLEILRWMTVYSVHTLKIICWVFAFYLRRTVRQSWRGLRGWLDREVKGQTKMYLLVLANLFADLRVDHCFRDGPVRGKGQTRTVRLQTFQYHCNPRRLVCVFLFTWLQWGSSDWGPSWRRGRQQRKQLECEQLSGNSDLWWIGRQSGQKGVRGD